jgi:outer membrane lipoprotein-sorting protein
MKVMAVLAYGLLAAALVPGALGQDNEAEKLFRAMEKKIAEAKALKVAVMIEAGRDTKRPASFKGSLLLTKDNKARLKVSGVDFGEARNWEMVSNGKQVRLRPYAIGVSEVAKEEATLPTPKNFHGHIARQLSLLGVFPNLWRMPVSLVLAADGPQFKFDRRGLRAGAAEKVGGRDAKVVRYQMNLSGIKDDDTTFTVWIDVKTLLPLKRVSVFGPRSGGGTVTEVYKELTLDPRIDAGAFDLVWQVNEAEKLFRTMEEKLKAANAVQATFDVELKGHSKDAKGKASPLFAKGKGSLLFTKENQARLKITVDEMGKKVTTEAISDGKRMKFAKSPEVIAKAEADPSPPLLHGLISTMVSGPGLWLISDGDYLNAAAPGYFKFVVEGIRLVAFEAGAPEKVGGRDAKVISYMVAGLPEATYYHVTLWIDAHTLLPLKRVIVPVGGESGRVTETCDFTLNPKIAAGAFQLPK